MHTHEIFTFFRHLPSKILLFLLIICAVIHIQSTSRIYGGKLPHSNPKRIAITFDDGPNPKIHKGMIQVLRRFNVPATFFQVGVNIEKQIASGEFTKEMAKDMLRSGHLIGSHSYNHPSLDKLSKELVKENFDKNDALFTEYLGKPPILFREPYGRNSRFALEEEDQRGYIVAHWGFDSNDWRCGSISEENDDISSEELLKKRAECVLSNVRTYETGAGPGAVILFHEHEWTYHALENFIIQARENGYEFVSLIDFMTEEMKNRLWRYYECDRVKSWKDLYYQICQQMLRVEYVPPWSTMYKLQKLDMEYKHKLLDLKKGSFNTPVAIEPEIFQGNEDTPLSVFIITLPLSIIFLLLLFLTVYEIRKRFLHVDVDHSELQDNKIV